MTTAKHQQQTKPHLVCIFQVGLKAYLLWEANGRPDGGDFSEQARAELRAELRAGKSLQEVEQAMRAVSGKLFPLLVCWR
jgi:Protein of unknown function (DUF2934)